MSANKRESVADKLKNFSTEITLSSPVVAPKHNKTAPGALGEFMERESHVFVENKELKEKLSKFDGASITKLISPTLIQPSQWANRNEESFETQEFKNLKDEIANAGVNISAIKVRKIDGTDPQRYEIVFGHRRHRACMELGLDVAATIEDLDDNQLFVEMDRENRTREDLRPYEQGLMYSRGIKSGLYKNINKLCIATGVDNANAGRAIKLAELPEEVLSAFNSRLNIQFRWIQPLVDANEKEHDRLIANALAIASEKKAGHVFDDKEVLERLISLDGAKQTNPLPSVKTIQVNGQEAATIKEANGKYSLNFKKNMLTPEKAEKLAIFVAELMR